MRSLYTLLFALPLFLSAQTTHHLFFTTELGFQPDSLVIAPGDSIHLTFDTLGHSMVQVPQQSWIDEVAAPLIGIALGEGTLNPGLEHTFNIDSVVTIYYVCQQHPAEKGRIIVNDQSIGIHESGSGSVSIHPQPADVVLNIRSEQEYHTVLISDMRGAIVMRKNGRPSSIDTSELTEGAYVLNLLDRQGAVIARSSFTVVHP